MCGMIAAVWLLGLGPSPALAARYDAVEVVVEPQPAVEGGPLEICPGGYIEYRVTVRNHSKTVDHEVRLVHPARSIVTYYTDYLARNSRTVQVAHGSTLVVSLFQPSLPVTDQNLAVEIDGFRQKELIDFSSPFGTGFSYSYTAPGATSSLAVLASRGISQELKDSVRTAHPNEITFCRSELATGDWSSNWLGYTGYDLLLLAEEEAASLPADVPWPFAVTRRPGVSC